MVTQLLSRAKSINTPDHKNGYHGTPITEIIGNGFFVVDRKWTVKHWNKKAEELLNVKAGDITGKNLWEQLADILPLNFYANYQKAFLYDIPVHFEEYWEEMGAWFDVVIWHSDDNLFVSFKSSSDPVLINRSAQHLKSMNELYRFVTEITNDCLWEWNLPAKEIFWIDGGHKRMFGYQIENALVPEGFWINCLHPDDKSGVLATLDKTIEEGSGAVWEYEYRFRKADGEYAFVHDRGHIIYDDNKKACWIIGATQDITEKVRLQNKLVHERMARQREMTEAVLSAQEKEREDIGQELHDNLGQILAVAKMYLQMAKKYHGKRSIYLKKSGDFIQDVIAEIRKISKKLVIPGAHIIGLFDNIKNLVKDLAAIDPIQIGFEVENISETDLDDGLQVTIFRIVQEQVNNILKHANAASATIHLSRQENKIILLISDNGQGCDVCKEKNGVGIINIMSRAELNDGYATIKSKPGEGFELKVVLTLNEHTEPEVITNNDRVMTA